MQDLIVDIFYNTDPKVHKVSCLLICSHTSLLSVCKHSYLHLVCDIQTYYDKQRWMKQLNKTINERLNKSLEILEIILCALHILWCVSTSNSQQKLNQVLHFLLTILLEIFYKNYQTDFFTDCRFSSTLPLFLMLIYLSHWTYLSHISLSYMYMYLTLS